MAFAVSSFAGKAVAAKAAQTVASTASRRVTVRAGLYPEPGTYPGGEGKSPIFEYDGKPKVAAAERIHGRWAMLAVTGAWAQENGTGIPWYEAGALCTPEDCTALANVFPGAIAPLAPEGSGYPSFYAVLFYEVLAIGLAEAYRTGLLPPVVEVEQVGNPLPGGSFDPLNLGTSGALGTPEEMEIKELKHCRLAMFAWLGIVAQAVATNEGPIANWRAHVSSPFEANITSLLG